MPLVQSIPAMVLREYWTFEGGIKTIFSHQIERLNINIQGIFLLIIFGVLFCIYGQNEHF